MRTLENSILPHTVRAKQPVYTTWMLCNVCFDGFEEVYILFIHLLLGLSILTPSQNALLSATKYSPACGHSLTSSAERSAFLKNTLISSTMNRPCGRLSSPLPTTAFRFVLRHVNNHLSLNKSYMVFYHRLATMARLTQTQENLSIEGISIRTSS